MSPINYIEPDTEVDLKRDISTVRNHREPASVIQFILFITSSLQLPSRGGFLLLKTRFFNSLKLQRLTWTFHVIFAGILSISPISMSALEKGLIYSHFHLPDQTSVHCLEIDPDYFDVIIGMASHGLESVKSIAKKHRAVAAINGGFFQMDGSRPETPKGILNIDQRKCAIDDKARGAVAWSNKGGTVYFDRLRAHMIGDSPRENYGADSYLSWNIWFAPQLDTSQEAAEKWNWSTYIIGGAPLMIFRDSIISDFSQEEILDTYVNNPHARTAIGQLSNGHWIFLVVDGKKSFFFRNTGITISNLANLMKSIGCVAALNLDGGGSSTMVLENRVVNTPCGEKRDREGKWIRPVSNALLVMPKNKF